MTDTARLPPDAGRRIKETDENHNATLRASNHRGRTS
jgi:hypothetical protein